MTGFFLTVPHSMVMYALSIIEDLRPEIRWPNGNKPTDGIILGSTEYSHVLRVDSGIQYMNTVSGIKCNLNELIELLKEED